MQAAFTEEKVAMQNMYGEIQKLLTKQMIKR